MRSLRSTDSLIGGAHLYSTVTSYLQHTVAPQLLRGAIAEEEGGVFSAAAGLTEMAGWMAHDAGQDQVADQHFRRALSLARAGHDHQLGAHILASLSHLALHNREPDKAIAFAMQGYERLTVGPPHPGVEAQLLAVEARGHAALHQDDRCMKRLREAERALATAPSEPRSPWVSEFDEASLATEAARCFHLLGQAGTAQRQAERGDRTTAA